MADPFPPGSERLGSPAVVVEAFALTPFVRSAGILSLSSVAALVRAVITAKLFAVVLGPSAVGILAQLLNFSGLVSTIIALGLTAGVTKMVADSDRAHDKVDVDAVVTTALVLSLGAGLAALVVLAPFGPPLSVALTGTEQYSALVLLVILSFPLYNIASVLSYAIQGLDDVSGFTWANVLNAVATIVVVVPATLFWGLLGAMVATLAGGVIQCGIFAWTLRRAYLIRGWRMPSLNYSSQMARKLVRYGAVMLMGGVAVWGSVFAVRTIGIHQLGNYQNGLYQVAYGLSGQYTAVFMMWMAAYVFPRIAGHPDGIQLSRALNSTLRANLLLMVPGLALVIGFRHQLINVFYSGAFAAAAPLIVWQGLGDYARVVGWSFGVSLFARGRTGSHLFGVAAQSVAWVAASVLLIPKFGTSGIAAGYAISFALWPLIMFPIARHWFGIGITRANVVLIGIGLGVLAGAAIAPWPLAVALAGIMPAAIFILNRGRVSQKRTASILDGETR